MLLIEHAPFWFFSSWVFHCHGSRPNQSYTAVTPSQKKAPPGAFLFSVYVMIMSAGSIPAIPTHDLVDVLAVAND